MEPTTFETTLWSRLAGAKGGSRGEQEKLYHQYRRPVLRFVERNLPPGADAELVTDEVMQAMLDPAFLAEADRSKGRFRDLLLAMARHAVCNAGRKERRQKRGGGLHRVGLEDLSEGPQATEGERHDFEAFFAEEVIAQGMERLREDAGRRGSPEAEALRLYYDLDLSQAEIASNLGIGIDAANNHLHRGRTRLRGHIEAVLAAICSSREELQEYVGFIKRVFANPRR